MISDDPLFSELIPPALREALRLISKFVCLAFGAFVIAGCDENKKSLVSAGTETPALSMNNEEDPDWTNAVAGINFSEKDFLDWRAPRLGKGNPERMNNPYLEWSVRFSAGASRISGHFKAPSPFDIGPCWNFDRLGQTQTTLPDGRIVFIAGEHEDFYDPDFYIYNDVVVKHPDGKIDIFGYPREVFPATDFHSATLVGEKIIIIGSLGYGETRRAGITPVFALDLKTFSVASVKTSGDAPGWIHQHKATLAEDKKSILICGGLRHANDKDGTLTENNDEWRLHLPEMRWERSTNRRWQSFEVRRRDEAPNHLWRYMSKRFMTKMPPVIPDMPSDLREMIGTLKDEIGCDPDFQTYERLCKPDGVPHEYIPQNSEEIPFVTRIRVNDVIVRYVEEPFAVRMVIEGELPPETVKKLSEDLKKKMSILENARCDLKKLPE